MKAAAHNLVAETAEGLAEALYEDLAKDNFFHSKFAGRAGRRRFVKKMTPSMFEQAREVLTRMLSMDYPESDKQKIYEALVLDNTLTMGRRQGERLRPEHFH